MRVLSGLKNVLDSGILGGRFSLTVWLIAVFLQDNSGALRAFRVSVIVVEPVWLLGCSPVRGFAD